MTADERPIAFLDASALYPSLLRKVLMRLALIGAVTRPGIDDRHVLAAAIHCGARVLVTANLRHFPASVLRPHRIEARHPDEFILSLINATPIEVGSEMRELRASLKRPPVTAPDLLSLMARQDMRASAGSLGGFIGAL